MNDAAVEAELAEPSPAPPQSAWGWRWMWFCRILLVLVVYVGVRLIYEQACAPLYAPSPAITIGHDTTRIDGPLDADGYVDYAAALDAPARQDVTPENNGVVLYFQAVGPRELVDPKVRAEFFARLGMSEPPAEGEYLRELRRQEDGPKWEQDSLEHQRFRHGKYETELRPWTRDEFPEIAAWLDTNAKPLDKIVAASRRPKWYVPLISTKGEYGLAGGLLPHCGTANGASTDLAKRAMLKIAAGDFASAWDDAEAISRLARLFGQGSFRLEYLTQCALDRDANRVYLAIAVDPRVTPDARAKFQQRYRELPPPALGAAADCIDRGERFMGLDYCRVQGRGSGMTSLVDWNEALRQVNAGYDVGVAAMRETNFWRRRSVVVAAEAELQKRCLERCDPRYWAGCWLRGESLRTLRGRWLGETTLMLMQAPYLATIEAEMAWYARRDITDTAFALEEFRAQHGTYPASLDELDWKAHSAPSWLFADSGRPVGYRRDGDGYFLFNRLDAPNDGDVPDVTSKYATHSLVFRIPFQKLPFIHRAGNPPPPPEPLTEPRYEN